MSTCLCIKETIQRYRSINLFCVPLISFSLKTKLRKRIENIVSFKVDCVKKWVPVCVLKKRKTVSAAAFVGSAALKVGPSKLNASKLLITESRSTVLPLRKVCSCINIEETIDASVYVGNILWLKGAI